MGSPAKLFGPGGDVTVSTPFDPSEFAPAAWVERHGLPPGGALFDAGGPIGVDSGRYTALCLEPVEVLSWRLGDPGDPFRLLEALQERARLGECPDGPAPLVACALAYDLGRVVERLPERPAAEGGLPDLWAARYDAAWVYDRWTSRGHFVGRSADLQRRLAAGGGRPRASVGPARALLAEAEWAAAVARIQAHIRAGDVYQVNMTARFEAPFEGEPAAVFGPLHRRSPVPFAALLRLDGRRAILSTSPERFLRWTPEGRVETRPIKGTRPRHPEPDRDRAAADELRASAKDAAEHVMIVDLERNDLGRVCVPGSVGVERLAGLERYATVQHLVSTVSGRLRRDVGLAQLLRATFPGGSITGAPKVRAMQLVERIEPTRRGIYCGAVGYLDARGGGDLNVAIRTAWQVDDRLHYQAGGGIVVDSDAAAEWAEVGWKARAFLEAVSVAGPDRFV